ncbi:hypothetical protein SPRG_21418, partial [Saprolegnia parasitica CBS 223.65]
HFPSLYATIHYASGHDHTARPLERRAQAPRLHDRTTFERQRVQGTAAPHARSMKVVRLALKMEQKLFDATHGRKLSDTSIQKYLVVLAARACKSWVRTVPI